MIRVTQQPQHQTDNTKKVGVVALRVIQQLKRQTDAKIVWLLSDVLHPFSNNNDNKILFDPKCYILQIEIK